MRKTGNKGERVGNRMNLGRSFQEKNKTEGLQALKEKTVDNLKDSALSAQHSKLV